MASLKDLKKRIGTVKNTQQTTRAMKMVSAAKLRRAQFRITNMRPYARKMGRLIQLLSDVPSKEAVSSDLIDGTEHSRKKRQAGQKPTALLVLVTSDRGLCGGFNTNIIKKAESWRREHANDYQEIKLAFVGRKANEYYKARKIAPIYYREFGRQAEVWDAREVVESIVAEYRKGSFDEVIFVYNEFKNAISQVVQAEPFLPIRGGLEEMKQVEGVEGEGEGWKVAPELYVLKPGREALLNQLMEKHFVLQALRIMLESMASEHGARMSAMENATKNAGEMIEKLTLDFNKQRQAGITSELLEIISGTESLKD